MWMDISVNVCMFVCIYVCIYSMYVYVGFV